MKKYLIVYMTFAGTILGAEVVTCPSRLSAVSTASRHMDVYHATDVQIEPLD